MPSWSKVLPSPLMTYLPSLKNSVEATSRPSWKSSPAR